MDVTSEVYRRYKLLVVQTSMGWQVRIEATGQSTVWFSDQAAALTEARHVVDHLVAAKKDD